MRITVQVGAVAVDLRGVDMSTRAIRIPDDLWFAALEKARANGDTLSDVVRAALARYVARK